MRSTPLVLGLALAVTALAACSPGTTDPTADRPAASVQASDPGAAPGPGFGTPFALRRLPAELKPSADQQTKIQALVTSFRRANQADLEKVRTTLRQARAARRDGTSVDDVRAMLQDLRPVRERLRAASAELRTQVDAVLTDAQKSWLADHAPKRCLPGDAPALSDAQKQQIKGLVDVFRRANQSDLDAVRAAMRQAREARRSGAATDPVKAALQQAKPAMDRLRTAHEALRAKIDGVLTPEQRASGCVAGLLRMGGGPGRGPGTAGFGPHRHGFMRGGAGFGPRAGASYAPPPATGGATAHAG